MAVKSIPVEDEAAGIRLDRWFRRHFPTVPHGRLEKLIRSGQVRVDGARVRSNTRLEPGQTIRVPPLANVAVEPPHRPRVDEDAAAAIQKCVLYRDDDALVIDKPAGLAVQSGSRISHHLDGMLDALKFDRDERPRLVHRLDKDTSGVLLLARNVNAATRFTAAFRNRSIRKLYWAFVVGVPRQDRGTIDTPLAKGESRSGERIVISGDGRAALTHFAVVESVGDRGAWLALEPKTGRTHQLRAHLASIGTPIHGDGKYGGRAAFLKGEALAPKLHLHAREIRFIGANGGVVRSAAPLPPHMSETWALLGFDPDLATNPFAETIG